MCSESATWQTNMELRHFPILLSVGQCVVYKTIKVSGRKAPNVFLKWFLTISFHQPHVVLHLLTHPFEIQFHSKLHPFKTTWVKFKLRHFIKIFQLISTNFISVGQFQTLKLMSFLWEHTWTDFAPIRSLAFYFSYIVPLNMFTTTSL